MYDLHAHILPAVDDGPKSLEDAVEMARVAFEGGTKVILATPHRKDVTEKLSVAHIRDLVVEFRDELDRRGIDLEVLLGMENHLDLDLPDEYAQGRALPINDSRYALVELPFFGYPNYVEEVLFQLQLKGVTPVLAHPERIEAFQREPDLLAEFVDKGMLSQITAGSIVGHFNRRVRRVTRKLLQRGLVHIIASDTHFPGGPRSPRLAHGVEAAARIVGHEKALTMVQDTPKPESTDGQGWTA